jgi:hypothetical protein
MWYRLMKMLDGTELVRYLMEYGWFPFCDPAGQDSHGMNGEEDIERAE